MNTTLAEKMAAKETLEVISPITGEVVEKVGLQSTADVDKAVDKAKEAFNSWSKRTLRDRSQILYTYRNLLKASMPSLAEIIRVENGKTYNEAKAEVEKAIEVTEFACSLPQLNLDTCSEVSRGIYCRMSKKPLGVVASITPLNFPCMVPHWTIPIAIALGNCMILKPSEQVPLTGLKIEQLLLQAGVPEGVFQVVNGKADIAQAITQHPDIKAVSFVGSTKVAKLVYEASCKTGKRALCLGGAKNHLLVLPDANPKMAGADIAASMSGCAGQRCMAASVLVAVGDVQSIIKSVVDEAKKLIPGQNLGAITTCSSKERIEGYISQAIEQGATLLLDGRGVVVEGKENGFYVGPTILDNVTPDMAISNQEVFGPVLSIMHVDTVDEAIALQNKSNYGNGASVFTQSGSIATKVAEELKAGMIGVNIGVPVPREPFSFGGWDDSRFGVGDITGESSIDFWTQRKKITTKWNAEDKKDWMS